jgi:hypothetical protein
MKKFLAILAALAMTITLNANLPMEFYPKTIPYDGFMIYENPAVIDDDYFNELQDRVLYFMNNGGQIIIGQGLHNQKIRDAVTTLASFHEFILKGSGDYWLMTNAYCTQERN